MELESMLFAASITSATSMAAASSADNNVKVDFKKEDFAADSPEAHQRLWLQNWDLLFIRSLQLNIAFPMIQVICIIL